MKKFLIRVNDPSRSDDLDLTDRSNVPIELSVENELDRLRRPPPICTRLGSAEPFDSFESGRGGRLREAPLWCVSVLSRLSFEPDPWSD